MGFDLTGNQNTTNSGNLGRTDVIFQDFKLYIEGVQVPFMSATVQSSLGQLPRMTIQVPSQKGLMEICRYYEPKVHLFFADPVTKEDCLFFSGNIVSTQYYKSTSSPGRKMISFACEHRYDKLKLVTLDYSGYASDASASTTEYNENSAAIKAHAFNSLQSIGMALTGIDPEKVGGENEVNLVNVKKNTQFNSVPQYLSSLKYRYTGFPGVLLNLWNQLKAQTYKDPQLYESMTRLYIPLVEQGIQLFQRVGGHFMVEDLLNNTKQDPCKDDSTGNNALETSPRLIPPAHRSFMRSAVQSDVSAQLIYSLGQFSGELTSFMEIIQNFMYSIEYDVVFLNAPAEVPKDPHLPAPGVDTYAMDVIVKPQMPHYYAPLCNVVLPFMITSLNISQNEQEIPTRVTAVNDNVPQSSGQFGSNYRAPESVREAIARGIAQMGGDSAYFASLARTTASAHFKVGKYEQGRGIKHHKIQLPRWLATLAESLSNQPASDSESVPADTTDDGMAVARFREAWHYKYDPKKEKKQLNPWDPASEVNAFQRMLFSAADYKFTTETAKARTGSASLIFNPYIVPGYPVDIIDPTPTEPSFHAFCVDVTHTITARTLDTNISFVSAISYEELGNYENQYIHPWLESATSLLSEETDASGKKTYKSSIINNVPAREYANEFYKSALGVGAAAPELLYDFSTGMPYAFSRVGGSPTTTSGNALHSSGEGNLSLVFRPIETKAQYEERFGIKFIDMTPEFYDPVVFSYQDPILDETRLLEPGASMFLDYADTIAPSRDEEAATAAANATKKG